MKSTLENIASEPIDWYLPEYPCVTMKWNTPLFRFYNDGKRYTGPKTLIPTKVERKARQLGLWDELNDCFIEGATEHLIKDSKVSTRRYHVHEDGAVDRIHRIGEPTIYDKLLMLGWGISSSTE